MLISIWQMMGLPEGPGSTPAPYTPCAGQLTYVVWYAMQCDTAGPGIATSSSPFEEWIETDYPSLVAARNQQDDSFFMPIKNMLKVFGGQLDQDGSLERFAECLQEQRAPFMAEFGDTVNLAALDAIDTSSCPVIFQWFQNEYFAIFRDFVPFTPARFLASINGFNLSIIKEMRDIFENEPIDHPAHRLERWWIHASRTAGLKAVQERIA